MTRPSWRAVVVFLAAASLAFLASYRMVLPLGSSVKPKPADEPKAAAPQPAIQPLPLVAGTEITASLAGGQAHHYSLRLEPDQFVDLVVEQQGIDVVLELFKPNGERETRVDSPNEAHGPEPLPVLGETAGEYELAVAAGNPGDSVGRYLLRLRAVRTAGAEDRLRVEAERKFATGEGLRREGTAESLEEAVRWDQEALTGFQALRDHNREADALHALGRVHELRDDWAEARDVYQAALPLFRLADRTAEEAATLTRMGFVLFRLGLPEPALELFKEARSAYQRIGHRHQASALRYMGLAYAALGDLESALQAYTDAYREFIRQGDSLEAGACQLNIGELYLRRGETESATDACEEALSRLQGTANPRGYAQALAVLGQVHYFSGRAGQGRALLDTALAMQRRLGARQDLAISLNSQALVLHELGETEIAKAYLREAAEIESSLGDQANRAITLANLGQLELESGFLKEAETRFGEVLQIVAEVDSALGEATALFGLGKLLAQRGSLDESAAAFERCSQIVEDVRDSTASAVLRRSFLALQQPTYAWHIETLMRLHAAQPDRGFDVEAFNAAERSRARGLLDDLLVPPAALRSQASQSLVEEEATLGDAINRAARERQTLLAAPGAQSRLDDLNRTLRTRLATADQVEATLRRGSPLYRALPSAPTLTLERVQQEILDERTVLLEYGFGSNESFLWAVTKHSVSSFVLPPRKELEEKAAALYRALSLGDQPLAAGDLERLLAQLSDALLAPAASLVRGRRVLIVPEGDLALVPFAALRIPTAGSSGVPQPPDLEPLALRHELMLAPSVSSLAFLRKRSETRPPAANLLAAIGDPVFGLGDPRFGSRRDVLPRSVSSTSVPLPRLLYAEEELESILALTKKEQPFAALGFEANRHLLQRDIFSRYRILHFATHGVFDPEFPELSAIVLSTLDQNGTPQDGFVRAHELRRMDLRNELVVVSACETARGKKVRGEGVVGLASSLLSAGARQLMVSLWKVDDQATAVLIREFYRALLVDRQAPAAALQHAQAAISREPRWRSPYYWAGFVLIGDDSVVLKRDR